MATSHLIRHAARSGEARRVRCADHDEPVSYNHDMPNYRRAFFPGGSYFLTIVTEKRTPIFRQQKARQLLKQTIRTCRQHWPFDLDAFVLLPDHFHMILSLPPTDMEYPKRIGFIKKEFTKSWLAIGGQEQPPSESKLRHRRRGVWQRKYWEHTCRDEDNYRSHVDYIHYNPVKHGYVECPNDWAWSSFHRYVRNGVYPADWCCPGNKGTPEPPDFSKIDITVGE